MLEIEFDCRRSNSKPGLDCLSYKQLQIHVIFQTLQRPLSVGWVVQQSLELGSLEALHWVL